MDLKEIRLFGGDEEAHWYYVAKAAALLQGLGGREPGRILDVGAGSGFFARTLLRRTGAHAATCVDIGYDDEWCESLDGKPIEFRQRIDRTDADLVLLMDVLEHVDDDRGFLRHYADMAPPGARFVISVPAFPWLWSGHDVFLEHRRRYTLATLLSVVSEAGLRPTSRFYFYGTVFPAAVGRRLVQRAGFRSPTGASDLRDHAAWLNALLRVLCVAEARLTRFNRAFGLTAFAVAEKTASGVTGR